MAKGKKASKKKTDGLKLPKQIAGVKIPKELRKQAAQWAELVRHPMVADILAAGLVAITSKMASMTRSPEETAKPDAAPAARRTTAPRAARRSSPGAAKTTH